MYHHLVITLNAFPAESASLTCCTLDLSFLDASKMEASSDSSLTERRNQLCTLFGKCDSSLVVYVL